MQKFRNKKIRIILLIMVLLIIGVASINKIYLKSNKQESKNQNKNLIAKYIQNPNGEYELSNTKKFPIEGYLLNTEKSSCKNGSRLSQNIDNKTINLTTTNREDRGAVNNNYVKFEKNANGQDMWWRIIRFNGNGTIRIIYNGTKAHTNQNMEDDCFAIRQSWNTLQNDAKYVGYMFGGAQGEASTSYEQATKNETDSDMKKALNNWYELNIKNMGYSEYLADSLFCNDRSIPGKEKSGLETDTGLGYGTNGTAYGGRARFYDGLEYKKDFKPIFTSPQKNDAFTVNDTSYGNGTLKYPITLIMADEVIAAGAILPNSNSNYYLGNINYMWTMTPANYFINRNADVITDTFDGLHDDIGVIWNGKTSPVINLSYKSALKLQGSGTIENPYTLISDLV